jgi:hypothetical protein
MFRPYDQEYEYRLDRVWFDFLGGHYEGRGLMDWLPGTGFRIRADVERRGVPIPSRVELPLLARPTRSTSSVIRFSSKDLGLGLTPVFDLGPMTPELLDGWLSVTASGITYSDIMLDENNRDMWSRATTEGQASLSSAAVIWLPEWVDRSTEMGEQTFEESRSLAGLHYEKDGLEVTIVAKDKNIKFTWRASRQGWPARTGWRLPEAVARSLSILSRAECQVLQCELDIGRRELGRVTAQRKLRNLGILAPFLGEDVVSKPNFELLVSLFVGDSKEAMVCRLIYEQIANASTQPSWQATELLVATILEATLRTLYDKPFRPGAKGIHIGQYLAKLRADYLGEQWRDKCEVAADAHERLRHRNAHPDWLTGVPGKRWSEASDEALDDAILLCHFYGKLILALAGRRDLDPLLPIPHQQWKPLLTFSTEEAEGSGTPAE